MIPWKLFWMKSKKSKEDVEKLGIMTGDFVCFDPRTTVTELRLH